MRRLWVLCFGNLVIGTGALMMIGMLPVMARDLAVPPAAVGQLIAAFAITIAVSGPFLGGFTSRMDRRTLLTLSLALYGLGHLAGAIAPGYFTLLALRIATALVGTLFTPQAAATAGLMVDPRQRGRAIAFVFVGWSLAAVIGPSAGAWVAAHAGWRIAFAAVGVLGLASAAGCAWVLPRGLHVATVDRRAWSEVYRHPALLPTVAVTAIQSLAQFTVFTYIALLLQHALGADAPVAALLFLYGVAGVLCNLFCGRLADRFGAPAIAFATIAAMLAGFVGFVLMGPFGWVAAVAGMLLWGSGSFASNSMQQVRLVALAPTLAPVSIALNTTAIYVGQFGGAATGGLVLAHAGAAALPWISIPVFGVALAASLWAERRAQPLARVLPG